MKIEKKIQSAKKNPQANVSPPFLLPKPAEGIVHKLTSAFTRMESFLFLFLYSCFDEAGLFV